MKTLRYTCVVIKALLIIIMGGATIMEKYRGSAYVSAAIYSSVWFVALWTLLATGGMVYILRRRLQRRPVTFMIHVSLVVILAGAGITWMLGREGTVHLRAGERISAFEDKSGDICSLDGEIAFETFEVVTYPGTDTPKTFVCGLVIDDGTLHHGKVSPNHVLSHNGIRYFLTSYDDDCQGVTLNVSKNSVGMGVSYTGYVLLMLSMLLFLLGKYTCFRLPVGFRIVLVLTAVALCGALMLYILSLHIDFKHTGEVIYSRFPLSLPLAIFCMVAGLLVYIVVCRYMLLERSLSRGFVIVADTVIVMASVVLTALIGLRGYISGHWPMTNGFETMQCLAWCALVLALTMSRRTSMARPFGLIVAGLALLVAMMGEKSPAVTYIIPVLDSPWLCLHVMLVMVAYSLLAFIMLGGVTGLLLNARGREDSAVMMAVTDIRLLYFAVFALAAGIFVGAVWANETWGRFWGWDPKEVWALITMLVYAAPLHAGFRWLDRGGRMFHLYSVAAFMCVVITYFGVNFFLGGLHSYAG